MMWEQISLPISRHNGFPELTLKSAGKASDKRISESIDTKLALISKLPANSKMQIGLWLNLVYLDNKWQGKFCMQARLRPALHSGLTGSFVV